jgi:hypothetical protein
LTSLDAMADTRLPDPDRRQLITKLQAALQPTTV